MQSLAHHSPFIYSREKLIYIGLWLIISFSSFAIHIALQIPPTLILFVFGTLILFLYSKQILPSPAVILPVICVLYFIISQSIIGAPFKHYIGFVSAITYFIIIVLFGYRLSGEQRNSLIRHFFTYSTLLLIAECFWRISHPALEYRQYEGTGDIRWIYQYKITGFMYNDSNVVGFHIMVVLFFLLYQQKIKGIKRPLSKCILIVLLILSFSRAAWFGTVVGWIYIYYLRDKKIDRYILYFLFFIVSSFFLYFFFLKEKIQSDLSFQSKLEIAKLITEYFSSVNISDLFFGIGFSNSMNQLDIYAHNFFMILIIESGFIGFALIMLLLIQFSILNKNSLFIIIPFLISTLSNTVTFMPYFYVIMALIYLDKKESLNLSHQLYEG